MEETLRLLESLGPHELATGRPVREAARELREAVELIAALRLQGPAPVQSSPSR